MVKNETKCFNPKCSEPARARGLCRVCYANAFALVSSGRTTWGRLEREGKAAKKIKRSNASAWLIGKN